MRSFWREKGGSGSVKVSLEGPVAELTITNPQARNALSGKMLAELADALEALSGFDGAVVLVRGEGDSFCSGADLNQVRAGLADPELPAKLHDFGAGLLSQLQALPLLSIAAIEGYALGGGAELACACDLRVMSQNARLRFAHATLGVTPGWGGGGRLTRTLGRRAALKILLEAAPISAEQALDLGLIDRVTPPGGSRQGALDLITSLGTRDPAVIRQIKTLVHAADTLSSEQARFIEKTAFTSLWGGPAHRRALGV